MTILDKILEKKRSEVEAARARRPQADLEAGAGAPVSYTHLTLPTICSV